MDYKLRIEEESCPVAVEKTGAGAFSAVIGEDNYQVSAVRLGPDRLLLTVNGRQVIAAVVDRAEGKQIVIRGQQYNVCDEDLLAQAGPGRKSQKRAPTEVTPPMPAVVVRIPVKVGDAVTEGQAVVVVSAMKMETTLYAPFDGTVTRVNVSEGEKVMPGDILVDIARAEDNP